MKLTAKTPVEEGYFMPAEWYPHEATWLAWPTNKETWTEDIKQVERTFVGMIALISKGEKVNLLVDSVDEVIRVQEILKKKGIDLNQVHFVDVPTVDVWIRDYGPNFLVHPQKGVAFNRWNFNAWGSKYQDLAHDHGVIDQVRELLPENRFDPGIVLEGGSIDVNGEGTCLTTKQCLLNPNRNPDLKQEEIEAYLKSYLGVRQIIWLDDGIEGDDTDGHIDDIARFVSTDTIAVVLSDNPQDSNHEPLKRNWEILEKSRDQDGNAFKLLRLPSPKNDVVYQGNRLPASYANFYVSNYAVLVPTFNDPNDQKALTVIDSVFPTRKVVGIDCQVMVRGFGTIHCASQQEPKRS